MIPSPLWPHQDFIWRLGAAFHAAIRDGSRALPAPMDVVFSPTNVLQPDLVLVLERNLGILRDVVRGVPDLVVEVLSRSTAARDRTTKRATYARFGVPECWIADLDRRTIEVYRLPRGGRRL